MVLYGFMIGFIWFYDWFYMVLHGFMIGFIWFLYGFTWFYDRCYMVLYGFMVGYIWFYEIFRFQADTVFLLLLPLIKHIFKGYIRRIQADIFICCHYLPLQRKKH